MWPYPWTHVGTPSHLGHMDRVAATKPSQAHAGAAQEAPDIGQWEGQDVPLVGPSSCNVKGGIPRPRRYLPTYLSSSASKASQVGNPTPPAKERPDLHWSTHFQHGADMYDESETEDGITDEECSDMEIEYIPLPKLKRDIRRADLTGVQVFLCCMPRPAVPFDQMYKMETSSDDDGLDPVRRKLPIGIHKWADLYDREKAEYGDLPPHRPGRHHRIHLDSEDNPPWVHPYKMDLSQLDELRRQLDKLHRSGRIIPSSSPYGAGCLLVKKANGKWRMCVDYRASITRTV